MRYIVKLAVLTLAVFCTSFILGIHFVNPWTALLVALVISLLNTFLKPVLVFFTIPFTVVTLGLFLLVINAAIIMIASKLVPGFEVGGFWWALLFSIILSFVNSVLESLFGTKTKPNDNNNQNQNQNNNQDDNHFDDYEEVK